jgi:hypothetical protein
VLLSRVSVTKDRVRIGNWIYWRSLVVTTITSYTLNIPVTINLATDCLPRISLRRNLFTNTLPSNGCTCNNIVFFSMALHLPWALASAFQFHDHFTDGKTPWAGDQLVTRPLPVHRHRKTHASTHTHINTKHPCPEWDSNPRSRLPSERRQCML